MTINSKASRKLPSEIGGILARERLWYDLAQVGLDGDAPQALEATVAEALGLSELLDGRMSSTGTTIDANGAQAVEMANQQARDKANRLCHSLARLCSTYANESSSD